MEYSINARPLLQQSDIDISESDQEIVKNEIISEDIDDDDSESLIKRQQINAPLDKLNFNYAVFYLLGLTSLVPWNFCVTAEEYWMYKFRNTTANSTDAPLTPIQVRFTSDLNVSAAIPSTIFLILNAILSHKIPLAVRMIGTLAIITVLFIVMTVFVEVNTDDWQHGFFQLTLSLVVVMNIAAAILSGGLFGIAGLYPSDYMTAVVSGQALGGIFAAVAEIISLTFGASPKTTAFVYFNVGNLTLIISIVCYIIMSKTLYFKYYTSSNFGMMKKSVSNSSGSSSSSYAQSELIQTNRNDDPQFMKVLGKIWLYGFSEWFVFVTTISVYPSVTVLINSQNKGHGNSWSDVYFVTTVNYLIFNSGDYIGRIIAGMIKRPRNSPWLVAGITILRIIFIPLFLLCNEQPRHYLPVFIHSDMVFILMMCIFSVSNGYIANLCLISAPRVVLEHEREMASSIMAAFLGIGLAFGSASSLIFVDLI